MAFPRLGGLGIPLNLGALQSNAIAIKPGQLWPIPAGTYLVSPGSYTFIQYLDPVTQTWRVLDCAASGNQILDSDGGNYRLANLTGTPIGGLVTTAGSSYVNGIFINGTSAAGIAGIAATPSAGASTWTCIVGGANNTIAVTTAGSGYTFQPTLIVSPPPPGGIQATASCTISAGAINAASFTNVGAGYTSVPTITVVNDQRDTVGTGGVLTASALTGSGTLVAMYPNNPGTVLTAVPTFTFAAAAGSSAAATAIMNFTLTGFTATFAGVQLGNAQPFGLLTVGGIVAGTQTTTNPIAGTGLTTPRMGQISGTTTAGGGIQTTGSVIVDGGLGFQAVPALTVVGTGTFTISAAQWPNATATVGGVTDTSFIQPI